MFLLVATSNLFTLQYASSPPESKESPRFGTGVAAVSNQGTEDNPMYVIMQSQKGQMASIDTIFVLTLDCLNPNVAVIALKPKCNKFGIIFLPKSDFYLHLNIGL